MIAEVIPEAYDVAGRRVSQPFHRRRGVHPSFPMGRYVSQPLAVKCETIEDVRQFLRTCVAMSDGELFGKRDYWQPPDEFERLKKGDCDDFALWTWRQLLSMGYDARFVGGKVGRYGIGHAWVTYSENGKCFLVEPTRRLLGKTMPRLSTLRYRPELSVGWDGKTLSYYSHKNRPFRLASWTSVVPLFLEWLTFWSWFWLRTIPKLYRLPAGILRMWRRKRASRTAPGKPL
jgi:hypothetical protein